jgi:hypothetical protein
MDIIFFIGSQDLFIYSPLWRERTWRPARCVVGAQISHLPALFGGVSVVMYFFLLPTILLRQPFCDNHFVI